MARAACTKALEANGCSVDWGKEDELVQSAMGEGGYVCVLLDLGLPRKDGLEAAHGERSRRPLGRAGPIAR
ncbi:MAG: hypothetical protein NVS2B4_01670 [Ramlibacter sp.]